MTDIKNVTVLGAGVLGAQIAYQAAFAGKNVVSYDINDEALAAAKERFDRLDKTYTEGLEEATEERIAQTRERISQSSDLAAAVSEADLVIEAVPEKLDLKKDVWSTVGKAAPEKTIFTTNTSTLTPSDFSEASGREERFLALHFANELWHRRTAEVMPTEKTDEEVRKTVVEYAREMEMVPVEIKREHPGYILNSLSVPFFEAAQRLWDKNVADPAEVDRDWRESTAAPMGPFQAMDVVGLRTVSTIGKGRDDEEIARIAERIDEELVQKGKTGVESGEGFLRYDENGNRIDD
ncbi:3-hydroxyacyl-CoA dehydrogenase [Corynebacterium otitidis]|uniref:3-hydroxyacyl-CoA dehydrogenase n=1 Tax=Corynebacterium otitidis TaxID=29321 RepID=UPI0006280091|nr:3-hydroxyacyl-CoA dehydrogenase [Corynebacterium otitidis]KKO84310.1 3-hydroxybutyryl-CoA dehydrogenase [Corynebacterium otitidis]